MIAWTSEELATIGDAEELAVASRRPDGILRPFVTIWVVRVGGDLYVRSVNGPTARLVPHHPRSAEGQVQAGSVTRDVTFVDDALNDDVDTAYRTKYRRHAENTLNRVTRPQARAITMN